jgi:hypothetical protein
MCVEDMRLHNTPVELHRRQIRCQTVRAIRDKPAVTCNAMQVSSAWRVTVQQKCVHQTCVQGCATDIRASAEQRLSSARRGGGSAGGHTRLGFKAADAALAPQLMAVAAMAEQQRPRRLDCGLSQAAVKADGDVAVATHRQAAQHAALTTMKLLLLKGACPAGRPASKQVGAPCPASKSTAACCYIGQLRPGDWQLIWQKYTC